MPPCPARCCWILGSIPSDQFLKARSLCFEACRISSNPLEILGSPGVFSVEIRQAVPLELSSVLVVVVSIIDVSFFHPAEVTQRTYDVVK
jgi:hypothetical protein